MNLANIQALNTQINQVSRNYDIVLTQINKIPPDRRDEIGALREAVRALMNSSQMHNAICVALINHLKGS